MPAVASTNLRSVDIFIWYVYLPILVVYVVAEYIFWLRPLKTKSPEEVVRYFRDHSWKRYRNQDLATFADRSVKRMGRRSYFRLFSRIFLTALAGLFIILTIVNIATGDTKHLFDYFAVGFLVVSSCADLWFVDYIFRIQLTVFKRYLEELE